MTARGLALIVVSGLLLAGCGGGGSGGARPSPPAPIPTYATLDSLTGVTTFAASSAVNNSSRQNTPTATQTANRATVTISYDAGSQTYRVSGSPTVGAPPSTQQTFGPAEMQPGGGYSRTSTAADGTTASDSFLASRSMTTRPVGVAGNTGGTTVNYTYAGWGVWQAGTSNGGVQNFNTFYFAYGIPTRQGDLPRTGSGSYPLQITGIAPGSDGVAGTGTLSADFAVAAVSLSLSPSFVSRTVVGAPFATVVGSGSINSGNGFAASLSGGGYSGGADGQFYGPQGAEVGGAFRLTNGQGLPVVGAFLGRK